jgi:hypothetical protein
VSGVDLPILVALYRRMLVNLCLWAKYQLTLLRSIVARCCLKSFVKLGEPYWHALFVSGTS